MLGRVSLSGSHRYSTSRNNKAARSQIKTRLPRKWRRSIPIHRSGKELYAIRFCIKIKACQAAKAHNKATAASTTGYRQPIQLLQLRHRPRSATQLTSGTFSHQASVRPHCLQCDRGSTTLSPAGQRLRHTFRKLPKASPSSPAKIVPNMRIIVEVEYTSAAPPQGRLKLHGPSA